MSSDPAKTEACKDCKGHPMLQPPDHSGSIYRSAFDIAMGTVFPQVNGEPLSVEPKPKGVEINIPDKIDAELFQDIAAGLVANPGLDKSECDHFDFMFQCLENPGIRAYIAETLKPSRRSELLREMAKGAAHDHEKGREV